MSLRASILAVLLGTAFVGAQVHSEPWLDPGNSGIRSDLHTLADAGVITAPITTWPIPWADIARDIVGYKDIAGLSAFTADAYQRMRIHVQDAMEIGHIDSTIRARGASKPDTLRTFENTPRENGEIEAGLMWMGDSLAFRINAQVVSSPEDGKNYRLDNSYIAYVWKNQIFALSTQNRWWGPSWEGSTILSNNARPVPSVTIQRNTSVPFKTKWLSWIGPWTYQFFYGFLEGNRAVEDAQLVGFRVGFKPVPSLEIGLSRTAQWCGDGRPCDLDTFWDLVKGTSDNRGADLDIDDEPGNQLAGVDGRWTPLPKRLPISLYTQWTAEDEADNLPSRWVGTGGIEFWGNSPFSWLPGTFRLHGEATNTTAEFYKSKKRHDYVYEHAIYTSGYRYRGRVLGHSMDNDGEMYSLGLTLNQPGDTVWNAMLRKVRLNTGGREANSVSNGDDTLWNVDLNRQWRTPIGFVSAGIGYDFYDDDSQKDDEGRFFFEWRQGY